MNADTKRRIEDAVRAVNDPEIPVPLADLGVVRAVEITDARVRVTLRPTRLACPGRDRMRRDVEAAVRAACSEVEVAVEWEAGGWSPATVTPPGRRVLAEIGFTVDERPACPYCGSQNSRREGDFGGSVCKRPFTCRSCGSPWDQLAGVPIRVEKN